MAPTDEQTRVKAVYEAVQDVFPIACYACGWPAGRQLPDIDSPETLGDYRKLNEAARPPDFFGHNPISPPPAPRRAQSPRRTSLSPLDLIPGSPVVAAASKA